MLMTPEGAIITAPHRPSAPVKSGLSQRHSPQGVPILMSVHGNGTFEGADVSLG